MSKVEDHQNAEIEARKAGDDLAAEAHTIAAKQMAQPTRAILLLGFKEEAVSDLKFQNVTEGILKRAYKDGHNMGATRALAAVGLGVE